MARSIAITTNTLEAGGAEMQRVHLANQLANQGHSVTILCLQRRGKLETLVDPAVNVVVSPKVRQLSRRLDAIISGSTNTEVAFAIRARLRQPRSLKWLMAIHNPMGPTAPRLPLPARTGLVLADVLVGLTDWHERQLAKRWRIRVDSVISNGIEVDWSTSVRASRTRRQFDFDLGFFGRLATHHKGIDRLFAALRHPSARHLRLAIAGEGPDSDELKGLALSLGVADRVHWLGHQTAENFFPRICVLALLSRYEGQPMVALEAQAANLQIVSSSQAGLDDAVNAWVVDADDELAVAEALAAAVAVSPLQEDWALPPTASDMSRIYLETLFEQPGNQLPRIHIDRVIWRRSTR